MTRFAVAAHFLLACLISPAAAAPAALFVYGIVYAPRSTLESLPVLLLAVISAPGLIGYVLASLPVLVLGLSLSAAARRFPALRRKRAWLAAGVAFGIPLGLWIGPSRPADALAGGAAGAACALTFRLIAGKALRPAPASA